MAKEVWFDGFADRVLFEGNRVEVVSFFGGSTQVPCFFSASSRFFREVLMS